MAGCNDCVHMDSYLDNDLKSVRSCKLGNKEEFERWWNENGHRTRDEGFSEMDCYEDSEFGILLKNAVKTTSELLETLK